MSASQHRWDTHRDAGHNWALVLAGGEGTRLHALTTTVSGVAVPKQFCSIGGDDSLLAAALRRAREVAAAERTCAVVAEHHRRWWQPLPLGIPPENVIAQPRNRGTATGILLPLLQIVHRDPQATLLVLPSDHYVRNEEVLASSLRSAMVHAEQQPDRIILLGVTPEDADTELGYIVADGDSTCSTRAVTQFIEKPTAVAARALLASGGVWNSFIFAAKGRALLRVFEARCPELVAQMRRIVEEPSSSARAAHLAELYQHLPRFDFSRDVLEGSLPTLSVLTVPACGWSDLGTPRRVQETFTRYGFASNACRIPA
jgi:mannose-1-phosphate guanylyltransferase